MNFLGAIFHAPPLPVPVSRLITHLPQYPAALIFIGGLNRLLKPRLPEALLGALMSRHIRLRVLDAGVSIDFMYLPGGFYALRRAAASATADLVITAKTQDFLSLALRREDADSLFFNRRLLIEGDTELAVLLKNTLDTIDFLPGRGAYVNHN